MDGQQTRPLVYAGSYTACCEGWGRPLVGALHNTMILTYEASQERQLSAYLLRIT
jgi:hypothetical protein